MNVFAALADEQMAAPVKAKARAKEKRAERQPLMTAAEKKLREQSRLMAGFRYAQRQDWKAILKGPHGRSLLTMRRALRQFGLEQAGEFIAFVENQDWLQKTNEATKQAALRLVSERIIRIRENAGMLSFDDALPGEPDCAWLRCRKAILGR